jgi:hypothetical protein
MKLLILITLLLLPTVTITGQTQPLRDKRLLEIDTLLAAKDYAKVFDRGRQILATEPDNFYVLTKLVQAGFNASQSGNQDFVNDVIKLSRKALELLDAGKVKDPSPLGSVDAARTFHSIALATMLLDPSPDESAALFLKLLKSDELKSEPTMYYYYGRALLKGQYQSMVTEFKQKYEGKPETPEAKALLGRINQAVARIVDTYARAVALSSTPEQQATRTEVMNQLTPMYKALHNNSDAGLNELIGTVLSQPMP